MLGKHFSSKYAQSTSDSVNDFQPKHSIRNVTDVLAGMIELARGQGYSNAQIDGQTIQKLFYDPEKTDDERRLKTLLVEDERPHGFPIHWEKFEVDPQPVLAVNLNASLRSLDFGVQKHAYSWKQRAGTTSRKSWQIAPKTIGFKMPQTCCGRLPYTKCGKGKGACDFETGRYTQESPLLEHSKPDFMPKNLPGLKIPDEDVQIPVVLVSNGVETHQLTNDHTLDEDWESFWELTQDRVA